MNCLRTNPRQSQIGAVLVRIVLVCVIGAGAPLAAQAPDIASLHKQAKEGNADSQYQLADAYLNGNGVPRDSKQGVEWLRKAASQDHPAAQLALSRLYLSGGERNIPKDPKQGLEWLRKSADHGYAPAEYSLGLLYRDGGGETGIPRNPHEAATWFRKAARQPGSPMSRAGLDEMLKKRLISEQEANWRAPEPTKQAERGKAAPFSLIEIEAGLNGWISSKRMATLVQKFGVNFKLNAVTRKSLVDIGADADLLTAISVSKRSS